MLPLRRNTVSDAIHRAVRVFRDRSALVFEQRDWSFNALDCAADRVARHLADLGLNAGERVAPMEGIRTPIYSLVRVHPQRLRPSARQLYAH